MGNETTFMYFYSTLAQSTAALAGLLFVAAQFYIQWLDGKITSSKSYIVNKLNPGNFDFYFHSWEASDAVKAAREKSPPNPALTKQAEKLERNLDRIQNARKECRIVSVLLIFSTLLFILQIPFVFLICNLSVCTKTVIFIANLIIFILGLAGLTFTVVKSMGVRLKNNSIQKR